MPEEDQDVIPRNDFAKLTGCNNDMDPMTFDPFIELSDEDYEDIIMLDTKNCYSLDSIHRWIEENKGSGAIKDPLNMSHRLSKSDMSKIRKRLIKHGKTIELDYTLEGAPDASDIEWYADAPNNIWNVWLKSDEGDKIFPIGSVPIKLPQLLIATDLINRAWREGVLLIDRKNVLTGTHLDGGLRSIADRREYWRTPNAARYLDDIIEVLKSRLRT